MSLQVQFASYGALPGGAADNAKAFDVTRSLQTLINANAGVVTCDNQSFGDPAPGNTKHFGAVVTRNGEDFYFACQEGQKIDFNHDGGVAQTKSNIQVIFAVYGALPGGVLSDARAFDVGGILQNLLNETKGPVACNNESFGGDPAPDNTKHFAAMVRRGGVNLFFACQEGQTIDFNVGGGT